MAYSVYSTVGARYEGSRILRKKLHARPCKEAVTNVSTPGATRQGGKEKIRIGGATGANWQEANSIEAQCLMKADCK